MKEIRQHLMDIIDDYEYNIREYGLAQEKRGYPGFLLKVTGKTRAKQALVILDKLESENE